jgi:hypothetical protein
MRLGYISDKLVGYRPMAAAADQGVFRPGPPKTTSMWLRSDGPARSTVTVTALSDESSCDVEVVEGPDVEEAVLSQALADNDDSEVVVLGVAHVQIFAHPRPDCPLTIVFTVTNATVSLVTKP